jgi:hypothetical protein
MNRYLNMRIVHSVLFYVLLMVLIFISKPSIMFEKNGDLKPFGVGYDKTMFSFGVFTVILAIMSFYVFCIIDVIFANRP